jgi:hypothetical protein
MGFISRPSRLGRIRQRLSGKTPSLSSSGLAAESLRIHSPDSDRTKDVDSAPAKALGLPTPGSSPSPRMSSDSTLNSTCTDTRYVSGILTDALETLDPGQRNTIQASISPDSTSIGVVLDEVHSRAGELQKRSAMKGWINPTSCCDFWTSSSHGETPLPTLILFLSGYPGRVSELFSRYAIPEEPAHVYMPTDLFGQGCSM